MRLYFCREIFRSTPVKQVGPVNKALLDCKFNSRKINLKIRKYKKNKFYVIFATKDTECDIVQQLCTSELGNVLGTPKIQILVFKKYESC